MSRLESRWCGCHITYWVEGDTYQISFCALHAGAAATADALRTLEASATLVTRLALFDNDQDEETTEAITNLNEDVLSARSAIKASQGAQ